VGKRLRVFSRLLIRCLVDETGAPIFTKDDADALEKKNPDCPGTPLRQGDGG
jgi:hypothetical protein